MTHTQNRKTINFDPDVRERVQEYATRNRRSYTAELHVLLTRALDAADAERAAAERAAS